MAEKMLTAIRALAPRGPYLIGGNCFGATLAFEIAHQIHDRGENIPQVILVHPDARVPMHLGYRAMRRVTLLGGLDEKVHFAEFSGVGDYLARTVRALWRHQKQSSPAERIGRLKGMRDWTTTFLAKHARKPLATWATWRTRMPREADELLQEELRPAIDCKPEPDRFVRGHAEHEIAAHAQYMSGAWTAYNPKPYAGPVTVIWPVEGPANPPWKPTALWSRLTPNLDWKPVPGNHWTMLHEHFDHSARAIGDAVAAARIHS